MAKTRARSEKRLPGLPDESWAYPWSSEKYRAAMRESFAQVHRVPCEGEACAECHPPNPEPPKPPQEDMADPGSTFDPDEMPF